MTENDFFVIIFVPSCLSNNYGPGAFGFPAFLTNCLVGWLSGQKQRSVKPSGYALHRFESYSYHHLNPCGCLEHTQGFYVGKQANCLACVRMRKAERCFGLRWQVARPKPRARCDGALPRLQENSVRNFTGRRILFLPPFKPRGSGVFLYAAVAKMIPAKK